MMRHSNSKGFTYIEVVISIFILVLMLGMLLALLVVLPANRSANHEDIALRIANHEIEALRGGGYATLPASGSFADASLSQLPSGSGAITVSAFNGSTAQVVVTVSWQEPENATPTTLTLTTLITEVGGLP